jgi:hypothetical protein
MGKVLRFELQVPDPESAIAFYSRTFGWEFAKVPGVRDYWFIRTGGGGKGIDGGLMRSQDGESRSLNLMEVDSIDLYLGKIASCGGVIVIPKTTVPGMGYFAYCMDDQGLLFGVTESDPDA